MQSQPTFSRRELQVLKLWSNLQNALLGSSPSEAVSWDEIGERVVVNPHFVYYYEEMRLNPRTLHVEVIDRYAGETDWNERSFRYTVEALTYPLYYLDCSHLRGLSPEEVIQRLEEGWPRR